MLIKPSTFTLSSSFIDDWIEMGLVNSLIFFDKRISDRSYLVDLDNSIQRIIILIFFPTAFFSCSPFNSNFTKLSSSSKYFVWNKE